MPLVIPDFSLCTDQEVWDYFISPITDWRIVAQRELTIALNTARALYEAKQKTELGLILKEYFNKAKEFL